MRPESVRNVLNRLFTPEHEPVFYPPKRVHHRTLPVEFPTEKCPTGTVRCRLPLMADGLVHLDTDPDVVAVAAYPLKADLWVELGPSKQKRIEHFADIALKRRDGNVVFLNFEPYEMQKERPYYGKRATALRGYYRDVFDCAYTVLDERSIYIQPRMSNLRRMWGHKERRTETASLDRVRTVVRSMRLPATIAAIAEKAALPQLGIIWEGDTIPTPLPEPDQMFTAIMQLAMRGEVRLDLGKPLSMQSFVSKE